MSSLDINIGTHWSDHAKLATVLCPTSAQAAKCVNKFISIMERSRKDLDDGTPLDHLGYRNPPIIEGDYDPNDSNRTFSLSSISSGEFNSSYEE